MTDSNPFPPDRDRRQAEIIDRIYQEWLAEQPDYPADPQYAPAAGQPSQFADHPTLLNAPPEAEDELDRRTREALRAEGLLLEPRRRNQDQEP